MLPGTDMSIGFPFKVYLSFVSTGSQNEPGDFITSISYLKFDPDATDADVVEQQDTIYI